MTESATLSLDKLEVILEICRGMNAQRDLSVLLDRIAQEAASLLEADTSSIFLLDREKSELWSRVALGTDEILRFDARLGIAGAAVMSGETVLVDDAYADPRFNPSLDKQTGYRTRSILAVPFRDHDGEVIGVFEVINKINGSFTRRDMRLLQALTGHVALVTETTMLLDRLEEHRDRLLHENNQLRRQVQRRFATQSILGTSDKIQQVVRQVEEIGDSPVDVLISGESGTGKELVARAIHYSGSRQTKDFVALNCAALPDTLIESELFGIEKGTATGVDQRVGKFEQAQGGTLFLDEIGDLSLVAQAKILRAIQERVVERVGGRKPLPVDVRIVAASNRDLACAIADGSFRKDLYYRLKVVQIRTPALREVPGDIALLANHFLDKHRRDGASTVKQLSVEALHSLRAYTWPGNVRELENEMKRLTVMVRGAVIGLPDLDSAIRSADPGDHVPTGLLKDAVAALERRMIRDALIDTDHNKLQAAKSLGVSRQGLIKKMKRLDLE